MFPLHRTLTLGYLVQHRTRTALVIASIALGVATTVATQSLTRGLATAAEAGVNPLADLADLLVGNSQAGVPRELAGEIRAANIPGVRSVSPAVVTRATLYREPGGAETRTKSVWIWGLDPDEAASTGGLGTRLSTVVTPTVTYFDGDPWASAARLALDVLAQRPLAFVEEGLAREIATLNPKDPRHFTLRMRGRKPTVAIMGTVKVDTSQLPVGDGVVMMALDSASALAFPADPGKVSQIGVTLDPEVARDPRRREEARRALARLLGNRAHVQTVEASKGQVTDVTGGLQLGMSVGGAGALVIGLFLVYNALSVSVAERRHDIGILRSVGATRGQIAGLFVTEAAGMGLLGSLLGVPVGLGLAYLAVGPLGRLVSDILVPLDNARISAPPSLLTSAVLAGTASAMLAALFPAWGAAREEPADAVRRVPQRHPFLFSVLQLGGTLALVAGGALMVYFRESLPPRYGVFGGIICLLVGALLSTPWLASVVARVVQPFFRHFLGVEGRLAADNLVTSPGRTGIVIAALAATGGLMMGTAGFLKSTEEAIFAWVEEKIAPDLFVTSGSSLTSGGFALSMNQQLYKEVAALPEVDVALPIRFYQLTFRERIVFLVALDPTVFDRAAHESPLSRSLKKHPRFWSGPTCLVSENFAVLHGVKVGDTLTIPDREGKAVDLEVVGQVVDYTWNRGTVLVNREWYSRAYKDEQVDVIDLFLQPGADRDAVRKTILDRWGQEESLFVIARQQVYDEIRSTLRKVYSMAYAQQLVVGIVALLGVMSALFISVLQRRRELGLLRAVGATRGQILWSVLAEAVLMGIIGAVIGFGIGIMLEWYVLDVMVMDDAGFTFPLRIAWVEAGGVMLGAIVLATLAGLWPAYLATRLRIPEAIAYE